MILLRHCRNTTPVPPDRGADTICVHDVCAIQLRCKCEPRTGMEDGLTHDRGLISDCHVQRPRQQAGCAYTSAITIADDLHLGQQVYSWSLDKRTLPRWG